MFMSVCVRVCVCVPVCALQLHHQAVWHCGKCHTWHDFNANTVSMINLKCAREWERERKDFWELRFLFTDLWFLQALKIFIAHTQRVTAQRNKLDCSACSAFSPWVACETCFLLLFLCCYCSKPVWETVQKVKNYKKPNRNWNCKSRSAFAMSTQVSGNLLAGKRANKTKPMPKLPQTHTVLTKYVDEKQTHRLLRHAVDTNVSTPCVCACVW